MINKTFIAVFFFVGSLITTPLLVLASDKTPDQIADWRVETQGWSIQDHMAAAEAGEKKVESLESRLQQMDSRIANLEKKPYFDPKGIQRGALKLLSGNLKGEMNLLNERVAWHYRQTDQAQLKE